MPLYLSIILGIVISVPLIALCIAAGEAVYHWLLNDGNPRTEWVMNEHGWKEIKKGERL